MNIKTDKPASYTDPLDLKLFFIGILFICLIILPFLHTLKQFGIGYVKPDNYDDFSCDQADSGDERGKTMMPFSKKSAKDD